MALNTKQANLIRECLNCYGHMTAEQVYLRCKELLPSISLATVYRNLNRMEQTGIISKFSAPGGEIFDKTSFTHAHFICEKCGEVCDVETDFSGLLENLGEGYTATGCNITIRGICPECRLAAYKS